VGPRLSESGRDYNERFSVSALKGCGRKLHLVPRAWEQNGFGHLALCSICVLAELCGKAHKLVLNLCSHSHECKDEQGGQENIRMVCESQHQML